MEGLFLNGDKMNAQQMWDEYSKRDGLTCSWEAWSYGCDPDELASLTARGIKTATASLYMLYEIEGEPLPVPGEHSVILDSNDEAVCIIRTDRVYIRPFRDVDEVQAWKEGEGDRSLSYWRNVHRDFFSDELAPMGIPFSEDMEIICEEFVCVYP
jgi:uncharacterized protein YhfF